MIRKRTIVAVLDDEPKLRSSLSRGLKGNGCDVEPFHSGEDFLASLQHQVPNYLILDLHMPRMTDWTALESLTSLQIAPPIIGITCHDEPGNEARAQQFGASSYLLKPVKRITFMTAIDQAYSAQRSP